VFVACNSFVKIASGSPDLRLHLFVPSFVGVSNNFARRLCLEERGAFCVTTRRVFFFWGGAKHARTQASKQAIYLSEMVTSCAYRNNNVW
jgi:hypothetical protein